MGKRVTQADRVLRYIQDFGSISRVDAIMDIGVANLPAVIEDLRHKRGINIVTNEVKSKNKYGQPVTYARYTLGKNDQ